MAVCNQLVRLGRSHFKNKTKGRQRRENGHSSIRLVFLSGFWCVVSVSHHHLLLYTKVTPLLSSSSAWWWWWWWRQRRRRKVFVWFSIFPVRFTHTLTHTHTLKEEKKIISRAHQSFFTLWNLRQHSASSVATAAANSSRNMLFFFVWRGGRLYGCCTGCMSMVHTSLLSVHTLKKLLTGLKKESKK